MIIDLDNTLEPNMDIFNGDRDLPFQTEGKDVVYTDLGGGSILHSNYMQYLIKCYDNHYGYVISPDHIWYTILCETAAHIKENAEEYRYLFTENKDGKTLVVIYSDHATKLDVGKMIEAVKPLVPAAIAYLQPTFSTSSEMSKMACNVALLDSLSPFYRYGMFLCGFPKIKILGTVGDWLTLIQAVANLNLALEWNLSNYCTNIIKTIRLIRDTLEGKTDIDFLKNILTLKPCGSGSDIEIEGWITDFYVKIPKIAYPQNFNTHVSTIEYTNFTTGNSYKMYAGLFSSTIADEFLYPSFGNVIQHIPTIDHSDVTKKVAL